MMNLDRLRTNETNSPIPLLDFDSAIRELDAQSAQWFRDTYGASCRMCVESEASRRYLAAMMNYLFLLQRSGQDSSIPLVILMATTLQIGYNLGRRRAEAEILEGWMRL